MDYAGRRVGCVVLALESYLEVFGGMTFLEVFLGLLVVGTVKI